jgi:hypothetical protein
MHLLLGTPAFFNKKTTAGTGGKKEEARIRRLEEL